MSPPRELLPAACVHVFLNLGHHILVMTAQFTFSLFRAASSEGSEKFSVVVNELQEIGLHIQGQRTHHVFDGLEDFLEPPVTTGIIDRGMEFKVQL